MRTLRVSTTSMMVQSLPASGPKLMYATRPTSTNRVNPCEFNNYEGVERKKESGIRVSEETGVISFIQYRGNRKGVGSPWQYWE